jgi:hypothetical protein
VVVPVVLETHPQQESRGGERLRLLRPAEVDVNSRQLVPEAHLPERLGQARDPLGAVLSRRHQEAPSRNGGEGHAHQELRVVANPGPLGGFGPREVEDELALAVALHVEGAGRHQPALPPRHQRPRLPARAGSHAAGVLQGGQPVPLEEGRAVADQGVPLLPRRGGDALQQLDPVHGPRILAWRGPPAAIPSGCARLRLAARPGGLAASAPALRAARLRCARCRACPSRRLLSWGHGERAGRSGRGYPAGRRSPP